MSNKRRRFQASEEAVSERLGRYRGLIAFLLGLSFVISLLALTGSFYMLQIYDRALTSGSVPTLLALSVLAIALYLFQGLFDVLRNQILVRVGARIDNRLAPLAHRVAIEMPRFGYSTSEALERGRDVDTIRSFVSGAGAIALLDLPWMPLFLGFVYILHPLLGLMTIGGACVLITLTVITEILSRRSGRDLQKASVTRAMIADTNTRNADVLHAMGFGRRAVERFDTANAEHLRLHARTSDITGTLSGLSKVTRMMLQSALLGLGAYLTIVGELSPGAIIACSVAASRALAPVEMAIGNWKGFVAARRSHMRLRDTLATIEDDGEMVELPAPVENFSVEGMTVVAPGSGAVLLGDVSFDLKAGDGLGLIGPSGSGKTTLAKGLVGVWPLLRGHVRFDGAALDQWHPDHLGRHIGYLPQEVSLMEGTVAQNIARFAPDATHEDIVAAAKAAGAHQTIIHLPDGYQTQLGPFGKSLSAGQRQRVGLARALFGNPFLVVLDEPNSNLDAEGEAALSKAIASVRARGGIVVVIAHRPKALEAVNLVGFVQGGRLVAFGPKDEIVNRSVATKPLPKAKSKSRATPAPVLDTREQAVG
ncbi:type I secretion protein [Thioclava sp. L04-15]|uniref:type I secretion system permease/ATPase n=1 Tax=Thioclava sp. L04-15 TaxID=1915318 RepID=UPI0009977EDD|nr:type I secretion system permease/ATPase [Thioclava sp. L04-15]OOY27053.1 type I secretion protein [Thioclava sp. L04-15]TNE84464.1 MAG: type I secretion system permease/ATPase [Paracoccaceae bacterium]